MKKHQFPVAIIATLSVATVAGALVAGPTEAAAAGCSDEMQSTTPQHSVYEPGKGFGQEVAFVARGEYLPGFGVDDYVDFVKAGCDGSGG